MSKRKFTDEQFIQAVANNITIKGVLIELELAPIGGNYGTVHRHVNRLNLDTSHWDPRRESNRGLEKAAEQRRMSIDEVMNENSTYTRSKLKRRLINESVLTYECDICGMSRWLGEPLSLHLDHINGIRNDNRRENLRFLCPNCHSLTPTYCGRANKPPDKNCPDCGAKITKHSNKCLSCARKGRTKIDWPLTSKLTQMIEASSFLAVSRSLGVSDNAIRKRIKNHPND